MIVVAGQECPSQNKVPLGIGAGMKIDLLDRMERKRSKGEGRSAEVPPTPGFASEMPTTPVIGVRDHSPQPPATNPQYAATSAPIPIRSASPSPFQQLPGPSVHSFKSLASHAAPAHHAVGWSMMLEDWFTHGVGSIPGAKPSIAVNDTAALAASAGSDVHPLLDPVSVQDTILPACISS